MENLATVDLVGVGLNATDTVIALPAFPARGSKMEYTNALVLPGGQVATAVVACARWGLRTRYVGKLGEDEAAAIHARAFAAADVEMRVQTVAGGVSAQSLILVDGQGERTVLCRRDEAMRLRPEELRREWIVTASALHVDGYDTAAATQAARWAKEAGVPVVADLDELYDGVDELLPLVDHLIVSRDFPERLTGERDLERALVRMQLRYGCQLTAATLGENGVMAWDGRRWVRSAAFCVDVVDTTGAGDVFHAGFIYGLLAGWGIERQMEFACAAAALNCAAVGARGGIRSCGEIEKLRQAGPRYGELPAQLASSVTSMSKFE